MVTEIETPVPWEEDTFPSSEIERMDRRRWVFSYAKRNGVGAEFGVFRGHFAAVIARDLSPRELYLVDPWTKIGEKFDWGDDPYTNFNKLTTLQAKLDTRRRMKSFENVINVHYVEDTCENFCDTFNNYSTTMLDFAYLDSSHKYDHMLIQLAKIDKVLSQDGVIIGDDWNPDPTARHHGVCRAVNDFIRSYSYQIVAAGSAQQFCIRRTPNYRLLEAR